MISSPRTFGKYKAPVRILSRIARTWFKATKQLLVKNPNLFYRGNIQKTHPQIHRQGEWLYGSIDKAMVVVGADPAKHSRITTLKDKAVLAGIRALHRRGEPLTPGYVLKHHAAVFEEDTHRGSALLSRQV